jgi:hypothetical protein
MQSEMNGQGHDRIPGAQELLAPEGGSDRLERISVAVRAGATVAVLPHEVVVLLRDVEVVVAPELVADLYDPSLVISSGYVGPDRRRTDRSSPPKSGVPQWLRRVLEVVLLTGMVVVPLTMIAARSVPPAATGPSPTQVKAPGKTGTVSRAGSRHGARHVFTASSKQIARAESAYQRALARVGASATAAAPMPSGGGAGAGAALTSQRTEAEQATASVAKGQQAAAAAAAVQQRAASQAQAAQARATDQAAAAQRRVARAATRAQAQAARAAAHAGPDATTPDGGTTTGAPSAGA